MNSVGVGDDFISFGTSGQQCSRWPFRQSYMTNNVRNRSLLSYVSHKTIAQIKKLVFQKLIGGLNYPKLDPFPGSVGHFGDKQRPF